MGPLPCQAGAYLLGLVLLVSAGGCASPSYHWQGGDQRYWVGERGRVLEVVAVDLREPYDTPFVTTWHHLLVEPCGPTRARDGLPCWPPEGARVSQSALRAMDAAMPAYRRRDVLRQFAERVLPGREPLARVLVGTDPLAIAFIEDPSEPVDREAALAGELGFVGRAALDRRATAVALVPDGIGADPAASPRAEQRPVRVVLFTLRQPVSLRHLMEAVGDRARLEQLSAEVADDAGGHRGAG